MSSTAPPSELPSSEKRKFIIRSCLGRGGFGEVYRASMTNANGLETDVAVKVLHTELDTDAQAVQRLRDDGKMLQSLLSLARVGMVWRWSHLCPAPPSYQPRLDRQNPTCPPLQGWQFKLMAGSEYPVVPESEGLAVVNSN